jgi:hypothetical protein
LTAGSYSQYEKISCGSDASKYNHVLLNHINESFKVGW